MKNILSVFFIIFSLQATAQVQWWQYSTLPEGGQIIDIASTTSGKLYVLLPNSVVYYSTDNGTSWQKVDGTYDFWNATNIEVDKTSGTLYVGTLVEGLQWTSDNGATWTSEPFYTNSSSGFHAYIAAIGKKKGTGTIAAIENLTTSSKTYVSTNGGSSFTTNTSPFGAAYKVKFANDGSMYVGTENGVYKSTNNGVSYALINNGMSHLKTTAVAVDNLHLVAGVSFNFTTLDTTGSGVYISTDGGTTWTNASSGILDRRITALSIDSINGKLYAGTTNGGVFVSANWGASWTQVNIGLASKGISGIVSTPVGIFSATFQSGIAYAADPIQGWAYRNHGLSSSTIVDMVVSPHGNIHLVDGSQGGVYGRNAGGWMQQNSGLPISSGRTITESAAGTLFASFIQGNIGLYRSVDSGSNWTNIAPAMAPNPNISYVTFDQVKFDGANNMYVLVNYHGGSLPVIQEVLHSADQGATWNSVFQTSDTSSFRVDEINVASNGALYLTQNTFFGEILFFMSADHGATFSQVAVNSSITSQYTNLVIDRHDSLYIIQNNAILRRNGINNWIAVANGGWSTDVSYHPARLYFDNNNNAYLSCKNDGMYYSAANTTSWQNISQGIPDYVYPPGSIKLTLTDLYFDDQNVPYALAVDSKADVLQGIYKFSIPTGINSAVVHNDDIVVFPNPATDNLFLSGAIDPSSITLIFDGMGRMVKQLNAGQRKVFVGDLPIGIYTVRMQVNGRTVSRRFTRM